MLKCSKQDEGTYIVTIKNMHGTESTAVSLMITQNAEEVQDYRQFLKATEIEASKVEEAKVNWGKLKGGKPIEKEKEEEGDRIQLKKVELLPRFIKEPIDQRVMIEKEAYFEAIIKSSTKVNVSWYRFDKEIIIKEGIRIEKDLNKNIFKITIKRASHDHEGEIKCVATNEHGSCEKVINLTIIEMAKLREKLDNITVNERQEAKFKINFTGKPRPTVKWFKEEEEIQPNPENLEIVEEEESTELVFKSTKVEDSGNYYAKLTNEAGDVRTNKAALNVNRGPLFVKVPDSLNPMNKDEHLRLECVVDGNPKPMVAW